MNRQKKIALFFLLVNGVCAAIIVSWWLYPAFTDLRNLSSLLHIQEIRYALKERNVLNYEANLRILADFTQDENPLRLIPYTKLTEVLNQVSDEAKGQGLAEREFFAAEPIAHETGYHDGRVFYHVRVTALYEGEYEDILRFVKALGEIPCHIDQITVSQLESSFIWVYFSLYGMDESK
jgi:hypothetical protein